MKMSDIFSFFFELLIYSNVTQLIAHPVYEKPDVELTHCGESFSDRN